MNATTPGRRNGERLALSLVSRYSAGGRTDFTVLRRVRDSIMHRLVGDEPTAPGALARVQVILSWSVNA